MQKANAIWIRTFSDPRFSVAVVLLAIAARFLQLHFYVDSFFDTSFQVIATQNFASGHGISTAIARVADLGEPVYLPLVNWPPGYSVLLTPFYLLCGKEYLPACMILEMLSAISIILLCRKILWQLGTTIAVINLFTLLTAFFIYYFYYTGSTDSIGVAFFLGSITLLLSALKQKKYPITAVLASAICLLGAASMKYLFFPVVFVIPVFAFIYGWQNQEAGIRRGATVLFALVAVGIGGLYLYQKSISGAGTYISASGRGFFPEHLLRLHPLIPCSFITPNTIRKLPPAGASTVMNLFRIIHIILLLSLTVIAIRSFFRKGLKAASIQRTFIFLSLALALAISLVLGVLSLLVDKELIPPDLWWTYVEDARYYGLADILVQLVIFMAFSFYKNQFSGGIRLAIAVLPFLLLPEAARGMVFTFRRVIGFGKEDYYWKTERVFFNYAKEVVKKKMAVTGSAQTVVTGSLYYANYRSALYMNAPVLEKPDWLIQPQLFRSSKPVILLAIIGAEQQKDYQPFIDHPGTELGGQLNGFYFYTLYVAPR
ncbi:MAG: hypothetical protein KAX45_01690 [Chitinophagaceae bacterium]|nr:hypothetical protein [Chitinophagaceae bacterium]MBP6590082.1 hypothetical protein [Chitinophagaceae bacterium]MBP8243225.1 hypothetical protein [Chitinophagaceae bacterium]